MKKQNMGFVVIALVYLGVGSVCHLNAEPTVNWGYAGADMVTDVGGVPTAIGGWFVQMYSDPGNNSVLSSLTFAQNTAVAESAGNGSDDILLSSFSTSLVDTKGVVSFTANGLDMASVANGHVYSVLFNNTATNTAAQTLVLDTATWAVPASGLTSYNITPPIGNSWQNLVAVPEPVTGILFGLGLAMLAVGRKRK